MQQQIVQTYRDCKLKLTQSPISKSVQHCKSKPNIRGGKTLPKIVVLYKLESFDSVGQREEQLTCVKVIHLQEQKKALRLVQHTCYHLTKL